MLRNQVLTLKNVYVICLFFFFFFKGIIPNQPAKEIPRTPIAGATCADSTFGHQRNPNLTQDFSNFFFRQKLASTSTPYQAAHSPTNQDDSPPHPDATFVVFHVPRTGKAKANEDEVFAECKNSDYVSHDKPEIQHKNAAPFATFVKGSEEGEEGNEKKANNSWNLEMDSDTSKEESPAEPEIVKPIKKLKNQVNQPKPVSKADSKEKSEKKNAKKPSSVELKDNLEANSVASKSKKVREPKKVEALIEEESGKVGPEADEVPHPEIKERRVRGRNPKVLEKVSNVGEIAVTEQTPNSEDKNLTKEKIQSTKSSTAAPVASEPDSPDEQEVKKMKGREKRTKIGETFQSVKETEIVVEEVNDAKIFQGQIIEPEISPFRKSREKKKRGGRAKEENSEKVLVTAVSIDKSIENVPLASTSAKDVGVIVMGPVTGTTDSVTNEKELVIEQKELKKRGLKPKDPVTEDPLVENRFDNLNEEHLEEDEVFPEAGSFPGNENKKRGRKPKDQTVELLEIIEGVTNAKDQAFSNKNEENAEVVEVKKRGRKPKEQMVVTELETAQANQETIVAATAKLKEESKEVTGRRGRKAKASVSKNKKDG